MSERIKCFLTYDIWKVITAVCIAAAVLFLTVNFLHPKEGPLLYVAVFDVTLDETETERWKGELAKALFPGDEKGELSAEELSERIFPDDSFRSDNAKDVERLQVLLYNHGVDVVIANEDVIRLLASYGYFESMETALSEKDEFDAKERGLLYETAGYLETDEISMEDHETGRGEVKPYALRLKNSPRWEALSDGAAPSFLAAPVLENEHRQAVSMLFNTLLSED